MQVLKSGLCSTHMPFVGISNMTVTVTLQFATIDEAASFLAQKPAQPAQVQVAAASKPAQTAQVQVAASKPAPTPEPTPVQTADPAPTAPTAEAAPAAAPASLDFPSVVDALRAYSKKVDPAAFKSYMATLKVAKVNDLQGKPEMWAAIVAHCNA